jgi:HAD superfamily hydrolase (TIGR01459 family)
VHDGGAPYPDAIDCLARLRAAGKRVVLLSNSGTRAAPNRARLAELGFAEELYDAVVTSGEATWRALAERTDPFFAGLGRRCLLWSRYGDLGAIEGLPLERVERVEDAEFLLLAGTEDEAVLDDFVDPLERAAARGLPMVCGNPDVVVMRPGGEIGMAPGTVARHYERLGGRVAYVGKPHRPVYELCLALLDRPPLDQVLAIGDSLAHDIAGGAAMGLDTALIMAGIHADRFDAPDQPGANGAAFAALEREYGVRPRWALPRFRWRAS